MMLWIKIEVIDNWTHLILKVKAIQLCVLRENSIAALIQHPLKRRKTKISSVESKKAKWLATVWLITEVLVYSVFYIETTSG